MYLAVCMRLPRMSKQVDTLEIRGRDSSAALEIHNTNNNKCLKENESQKHVHISFKLLKTK